MESSIELQHFIQASETRTAISNVHLVSRLLQDTCAVDKFAIDHEATIKYDTPLAKLDQFTLCTWMRFTKHDGDHVLFTYSGKFKPFLSIK